MPPKKAQENSKKISGNAKKAAAKAAVEEAESKKKATAEDIEWAKGAKSSAKKEAEAEKKAEAARKKAEKDELLKAELEMIKSAKPSASKDKNPKKAQAPLPKRGIDAALASSSGEEKAVLPALVASGIDDALDALDLTAAAGSAGQVDRHPERRVKAAYAAFEERRLPQLREEHKGLRMGQMKELIRKEFEKSEENPMNQANIVGYDATKEQIIAKKQADRVAAENRLAAGGKA